MSNKVGAIVSALITLVLFVGVPYFLPQYLPPDLSEQLEGAGFDLEGLTTQVMAIGVATAALTLAGGFVDPRSVLSLVIRVLQAGSGLVFMLVLLGAGNIAGMGYTEFQVSVEGVTNLITLDLRVFIQASIIAVALKVVQSILEWREARMEEEPGRISP